jgi:1,4-dihydroxy-6-naphthoate synthase
MEVWAGGFGSTAPLFGAKAHRTPPGGGRAPLFFFPPTYIHTPFERHTIFLFDIAWVQENHCGIDMEAGNKRKLTLGHSPDPDDAFMFYGLAKGLIPSRGFEFEHILQDIQTLNERATRGELDISAISIHAYAYVSDKYALLPSGASMGDGYGPMLVAKHAYSKDEVAKKKIAVPGTMTSAFLALQLWLGKSAREFNYIVVPFDQIFQTVKSGAADVGLIIHEGQLTYKNEGLTLCEDLGVWWGKQNDGLPLPLGGNVIHKRFAPETRSLISRTLTESIQFSLDHRPEAVQHALQYARDMGKDLADKFVGMYVNHWTLDYGEKGRESIRRFLGQAFDRELLGHRQELEFVT